MGAISAISDAIIVIFSFVLALACPLIDAQTCISESMYPAPLVELKNWYGRQFDDYIIRDKPHFFVGLTWIEIFIIWPLSIANLYGILGRRPWVGTTMLIVGVAVTTSMAAVMADVLNSGKGSEKLIQMYTPFGFFGLLAFIRGLCYKSRRAGVAASHGPSARKKRA